MPKETFLNLPEEKQNRIIEAALDEFARQSYEKARVTVIAREAEIATGSFYQYFQDKKDLFKYIADKMASKKLDYIDQDMRQKKEDYDFIQLLREMYLSGFKFARENPRLVALGNNILKNEELRQEIWKEQEQETSQFFQRMLEEGQQKGDLDPEIDPYLVAKLLTGLNQTLADIVHKEGLDLEDYEEEMEIIENMLYFIKHGIVNS